MDFVRLDLWHGILGFSFGHRTAQTRLQIRPQQSEVAEKHESDFHARTIRWLGNSVHSSVAGSSFNREYVGNMDKRRIAPSELDRQHVYLPGGFFRAPGWVPTAYIGSPNGHGFVS